MQENASQAAEEFQWTEPRERAALLLAEDDLTDEEIGAAVGVNASTIWRWKQAPEFTVRITENARKLGGPARRAAVTKRGRRIRYLSEQIERIRAVIEARAADPDIQKFPGGDQGLLVLDFKAAGKEAIPVAKFDAALLKTFADYLRQVAQEAGQWADKHEHTGPEGGPVPIAFVEVCEQDAPEAPDRGDPSA
jgi:hypothetical protein